MSESLNHSINQVFIKHRSFQELCGSVRNAQLSRSCVCIHFHFEASTHKMTASIVPKNKFLNINFFIELVSNMTTLRPCILKFVCVTELLKN